MYLWLLVLLHNNVSHLVGAEIGPYHFKICQINSMIMKKMALFVFIFDFVLKTEMGKPVATR